ncbi:winged helix-turn-helix domain-containing protein [Sneathiella aquimaris]|uniref:winged helix-turn-helix domain-containing protein n=1 Tax=Sneathiella aquimaris TaxID=2599305 RepID=UPI00146B4C12|nr:crosslink repair DNA glycosylase YcaQ family protein [Sneathiella aquimaris]
MPLKISNQDARLLLLEAMGLSAKVTGPVDVEALSKSLGFVQLDTIRVVERAHDHILWTRHPKYRPHMLPQAFSEKRQLFEHFTHDASLIPMAFFPFWQRRFSQLEEKVGRRYQDLKTLNLEHLLERIEAEGPLSTHAFDTKVVGQKKMWQRPPHKQGLEYLWYSGKLSTSHRVNFKKFYDLTERVVPFEQQQQEISDEAQINWLCEAALNRLVFATEGEIQRFWEAVSLREAKVWAEQNASRLVRVEVEGHDGAVRSCYSFADIEERLSKVGDPSKQLRILNPFDPLIRDRKRLERLFGFYYRIEIFVPEQKRQWGYYVYPILEGARFIGRIEVKADRASGQMQVLRVWMEDGVHIGSGRSAKLEAEINRFKRFAGLDEVCWAV